MMGLRRRKMVARWVEKPALDLVLALPGIAMITVPKAVEQAGDIAGGVATVASILLGLVGVVVTLYQGGSGTRMRRLRALNGRTSRSNWLAILRAMLVVTFGSLMAIALAPALPEVVLGFCGYATLLMAWRAGRLVWLTGSYLTMSDYDAIDEAGGLPVRSDLSTR